MGVRHRVDVRFRQRKGTHNILNLPGFTESNSLQRIYTIAGRIGYLWTPQVLARPISKTAIRYSSQAGALFESFKFTDPGILAGAGIEWMFAPNWSVFAEGDYIWTESDAAHDYITPAGVPSEVINNRQRIVTGLVGINYKFHWDNGSVVPSY